MSIKGLVITVSILMVIFMAARCNTVRGIGRDIHDSAQAVQESFEYEMGYKSDSEDW